MILASRTTQHPLANAMSDSDSDHSSNPLISAIIQSLSPTFETTFEDMRHVHSKPTTPMMTEKEISLNPSILFSNSQFSALDPESNLDGNKRPLSPVTDFDFSKILNLEGTSWAAEFTDCLNSPHFPIYGDSPSHATSSDMIISPVNGSPDVQVLMSPGPRRLPAISHKLREAKAPFWAAVSIDIQTCLWARASQKLFGREPTKSLFIKVCTDAINRQTTAAVSPIWEAVKVVLNVPAIVNNTNATKDIMVEHALQTKGLLHIVEAEVVTMPSDARFVLALMFSFTAAWVRYRSYCYEKAAFVVLPPAIHTSPLSHAGLLPQPQDFTPAFRSTLRKLIDDHTIGSALLHENPNSSTSTASFPPISNPREFVWFGNSVLKEKVHRALYDHTYAGWFGFLENVTTVDGSRFWAPIHTATARQVGQVVGWIEELLNFHLVQGSKARGEITAYTQPPDNFTAHDSVIKRVNRHTKLFSILSGGTGELLELDDKTKDALKAVISFPGDPALQKERAACLEAYREFSRRPAHLPYNIMSFQNL